MRKLVEQLTQTDRVSDLIEIMHLSTLENGGDKFSYHFTPIFSKQNSENSIIFSEGFPESWIELYNKSCFRKIDPIPDTIMDAGHVMTWGDAIMQNSLSQKKRRFVTLMQENGLLFGVGIPLFGPKSREAYASVGFKNPVDPKSDCGVTMIQMIMQACHQKMSRIISESGNVPKLSPREKEILVWVGKGKSNNDIAGILELSPDTVSTYLRRVFDKLGSRDRVGATVRALKLGIISL